jgi:hypothetical protein
MWRDINRRWDNWLDAHPFEVLAVAVVALIFVTQLVIAIAVQHLSERSIRARFESMRVQQDGLRRDLNWVIDEQFYQRRRLK